MTSPPRSQPGITIDTDASEGNAMAAELSKYRCAHAMKSELPSSPDAPRPVVATHPVPEGAAGEAPPAISDPWSVSEVRTVEGEYMVVGGIGQGFGLIACCPEKACAELIVRLRNQCGVQSVDKRPRLVDNDSGEISVTLGGKEIRGWIYANDTERRAKMLAAREYVEGWCDGREA